MVIRIPNAADRRLDTGFSQAFGITDRDRLHTVVTVMDQAAIASRLAITQRLLQCVQDKVGVNSSRHFAADDVAAKTSITNAT